MDNLKEATLQSELRFKDLVINPCHRRVKSILVCKFLGYHFVVNHPA